MRFRPSLESVDLPLHRFATAASEENLDHASVRWIVKDPPESHLLFFECLIIVMECGLNRIVLGVKGLDDHFAGHLTTTRSLTRRLGLFFARHPEVEIHLQLSNGDIDFRRADLDLAIMWGYGDWPDVDARELMPIRLIMVCSPSLMRGGGPLTRIEDLAHYPLLHESGRGLWEYYLEAIGSGAIRSERNIVMDDPNVLHQACIEGQGVALGAETLLADELDQRLLVCPFSQSVQLGGYYIVRQPGVRSRPNVSAFYEWLLAEASA